jgi:hypothetical protein
MGTPRSAGIPRAMVLRFPSCSSRGPGFVAPVVRRMLRDLDASVGAPEPHDFAVRAGVARPAMPARPPHSFPTSVTVAKRPSCGEETGRGRKGDLPDGTSGNFCADGLDYPNRLELAREIALQAQAIWTVRVWAPIAASAVSGAISVLIELKPASTLLF